MLKKRLVNVLYGFTLKGCALGVSAWLMLVRQACQPADAVTRKAHQAGACRTRNHLSRFIGTHMVLKVGKI